MVTPAVLPQAAATNAPCQEFFCRPSNLLLRWGLWWRRGRASGGWRAGRRELRCQVTEAFRASWMPVCSINKVGSERTRCGRDAGISVSFRAQLKSQKHRSAQQHNSVPTVFSISVRLWSVDQWFHISVCALCSRFKVSRVLFEEMCQHAPICVSQHSNQSLMEQICRAFELGTQSELEQTFKKCTGSLTGQTLISTVNCELTSLHCDGWIYVPLACFGVGS